MADNKVIKSKMSVGELSELLNSVSKVYKKLGGTDEALTRVKIAYETGGKTSLDEMTKGKRSRIDQQVEEAVCALALEHPGYGQVKACETLKTRGVTISSGGVRSVWQPNGLTTLGDRIKALEEKIAEGSVKPTKEQEAAIRKAREEGEAGVPFTGYMGAQDTYHAGEVQGIGDVYQQTFIDMYSGMAFVNLYTENTTDTAADMLNSVVLPFYEEHGARLERIFTDRGKEYCGKSKAHHYGLYLDIQGIEHVKSEAKTTQSNRICAKFNGLVKAEFYDKNVDKQYKTLDELKSDLDEWLHHRMTKVRTTSGEHHGKTAMTAFDEGIVTITLG